MRSVGRIPVVHSSNNDEIILLDSNLLDDAAVPTGDANNVQTHEVDQRMGRSPEAICMMLAEYPRA